MYYEIDEILAKQVYEMTHPRKEYKEGQITDEYMEKVDEFILFANDAKEKMVNCPERRVNVDKVCDDFSKRLADWYNRSNEIKSKTGTEFQTSSTEQYKLDREFEDIFKLKKRVLKTVSYDGAIYAKDENAIEKIEFKISRNKEELDVLRKENSEARRRKQPLPYSSREASLLRSSVIRLEKRLVKLKGLEESKTHEKKKAVYNGKKIEIAIIENTQLMTIQLLFKEEPDENIKNILKENYFTFSKKNRAYQRWLNVKGKSAAEKVVEEIQKHGR